MSESPSVADTRSVVILREAEANKVEAGVYVDELSSYEEWEGKGRGVWTSLDSDG